MKEVRWIILALSCLFVFGANLAAAQYKALEGGVKNAGMVSGRITLDGPARPPEILKVDEDVEACGGDRPSNQLVVNGSGGIKNVVLSIENVKSGKDWDFAEEFTFDQKKCTFVPRILLIRPKTAGVVVNSDSVGHNFHTISKGIYNINKKIQPGSKLVVAKNKIRRSGKIRAKCDIHSWMGGYWIVAKTPYTVLSDKDGNFSISDVPPGTYTVKIWHEKLGESEQQVVIKAGETTKMDAVLKL
ncbi:MAG: carboxypeptidase regulatory-like domain-containing protein [Gammaproteobacteria bacterium]|nr:carboxypeptidase regulatory-like domain-containing protein [Gammaproteobacteria bacterium]